MAVILGLQASPIVRLRCWGAVGAMVKSKLSGEDHATLVSGAAQGIFHMTRVENIYNVMNRVVLLDKVIGNCV